MNPIYLALDHDDFYEGIELVKDVQDYIGGVKLGLEFYMSQGAEGVEYYAKHFPVFLDLKFHDIPNTVGKAVKAVSHLKPSILTVHAGGGIDMMKAARDAAPPETKVVGVTVLTSFDVKSYISATGVIYDGYGRDLSDPLSVFAESMAFNAQMAGLDGIVCSGREVAKIKREFGLWPNCFAVVPGVRPDGVDIGDQRRTVTPREAVNAGADVLVIGRPITAATDHVAAAKAILESLNAA